MKRICILILLIVGCSTTNLRVWNGIGETQPDLIASAEYNISALGIEHLEVEITNITDKPVISSSADKWLIYDDTGIEYEIDTYELQHYHIRQVINPHETIVIFIDKFYLPLDYFDIDRIIIKLSNHKENIIILK